MADQQARQDRNQVAALILHTGTAGTSETIRAIADADGNLMVNLAAGEEINIGTLTLGTIDIVKDGTISSKPLATYLDGTQTANVTYVGVAAVGAASTANVWQMKKIVEAGGSLGDLIITWADGNGSFDNNWAGRATATYS